MSYEVRRTELEQLLSRSQGSLRMIESHLPFGEQLEGTHTGGILGDELLEQANGISMATRFLELFGESEGL
jgi:hypothetical protein